MAVRTEEEIQIARFIAQKTYNTKRPKEGTPFEKLDKSHQFNCMLFTVLDWVLGEDNQIEELVKLTKTFEAMKVYCKQEGYTPKS